MNNLKINNEEEILFDNALEEIRTNDQKTRQQCLSHYDNQFTYLEGLKLQMHEYEYFSRNLKIREECLDHYGYKCYICDKTSEEIYGELGLNIIEIHHENQICNGERKTNPIKDCKPICPNCHTFIHSKNPCYTTKETKNYFIKNRKLK